MYVCNPSVNIRRHQHTHKRGAAHVCDVYVGLLPSVVVLGGGLSLPVCGFVIYEDL